MVRSPRPTPSSPVGGDVLYVSAPNPFWVEEEKQVVVEDRASHTASKMIYGCARFVIPRRRVREVIRCIESRSIP
jgi:hypothetical protein